MNLGENYKLEDGEYKIIGIDSYVLHNLLEETKRWKSYTLENEVDSKRWVVEPILGQTWIFDLISREAIPEDLIIVKEYSGVADINFKGNRGFSTPRSSLVLLTEQGKLYGLEQFFGQNKVETYYFIGSVKSTR